MIRKADPQRLWSVELADESDTGRLADDLAGLLKPGDLVALGGDLGAGKSTLARAILRRLAGNERLEAPSPTFTLMQTYDTPRGRVVHADLYRVRHPDELVELGLVEEFTDAIALVEWPERGGEMLSSGARLDIVLDIEPGRGEGWRVATIVPGDAWRERIGLTLGARRLIDAAGWGDARRDHMQGDASSRAYERLTRPDGTTAILMISPPRPDGPPVRAGKPYSAIARLAERIDAFIALDRGLRAEGFSAPEILASDLGHGLLLIEDLGSEGVLSDGVPDPARYEAAAEVLAALHQRHLPTILPVADGRDHVIPDFDREALAIETELLIDWYAPHVAGVTLPAVAKAEFARAWEPLFDMLADGERTWVLRDYHSPNLIWLPKRAGLARVGLIDFQDAVLGHPAYDLVSLAQDARVDVSPELELRLIAHYATLRRAANAAFDMAGFAAAYAILGAQRNTKILGIFARLDRRDGKPHYLRHLPRIETYLKRDLAHPALADLKTWYETHLPRLFAA